MKDKRVVAAVIAAVVGVWLLGTWVTRYSLEQMAFFAPIAICVVGATVGVVLVWVKVILQLRRERRQSMVAKQDSAERNPAA